MGSRLAVGTLAKVKFKKNKKQNKSTVPQFGHTGKSFDQSFVLAHGGLALRHSRAVGTGKWELVPTNYC